MKDLGRHIAIKQLVDENNTNHCFIMNKMSSTSKERITKRTHVITGKYDIGVVRKFDVMIL